MSVKVFAVLLAKYIYFNTCLPLPHVVINVKHESIKAERD